MKKLLMFFGLFMALVLPVNADVMPQYISTMNTHTLGLYQASGKITLYKEPSEKSDIIYSIRWSGKNIFPASVKAQDLFVVYIPSKDLALLAVTDEDASEDWVQVIYNNSTGAKGWIKKDDPYKFLSWMNFYSMYGKKYGLYMLKGTPDKIKLLKSSTDDKAQTVATLNVPQRINLTAIRGNWMLVSVLDLDSIPKTGYLKWRDTDGVKYLFPAIK